MTEISAILKYLKEEYFSQGPQQELRWIISYDFCFGTLSKNKNTLTLKKGA